MSEVLAGVVISAKLATFSVLFVYVYLLDHSTDIAVTPLLIVASAFVVMVLGELVYVGGQYGQSAVPWLTDFDNLQLFVDVLGVIAALGAGLFVRSLRGHMGG